VLVVVKAIVKLLTFLLDVLREMNVLDYIGFRMMLAHRGTEIQLKGKYKNLKRNS
jgi:hypothetical protein